MVTHHFKDGTTTNDLSGHVIRGNDYIYKLVKEISNETENKEQDIKNNHDNCRSSVIPCNNQS